MSVLLTAEQAQQIEEALLDWKENFPNHWDLSDKQALATIRAARAQEQAEQEPVAWMCSDQLLIDMWYLKFSSVCHGVWDTPLYATPVRTKDLTDDEITLVAHETMEGDLLDLPTFARAIVTADREKNRA